jgi:hypothetical protein
MMPTVPQEESIPSLQPPGVVESAPTSPKWTILELDLVHVLIYP